MPKKPDLPSENPLLAKIDELRLRLRGRPSRNMICERAKLNRDTLRQLELRGPDATLSLRSINALAPVLGVDPSALTAVAPEGPLVELGSSAPRPREDGLIPVLGTAAGAVAGAMAMGDAIDRVERPPGLLHVRDAYALFISGDSMKPLHSSGDLRFIHPHKPPRAGDSVIVQTRAEDGGVNAWIKIYERPQGEWLICQQLNPAGEYKFKQANILRVHRVLTTAELFNK